MPKLSNNKMIKIFTILLTLLLVAKLLSLAAWWYLPSEGVELNAKKSYKAKYQRVDYKNMLIRLKIVEKPKEITTYSINSLLLKGLYGSRYSGFAIVAKKSAPKTTIVEVGEVYAGYKLKELFMDHVVFTKDSKEYMLSLPKSKNKVSKSFIKRVSLSDDGVKSVTKQEIQKYSKNPSQIWRDISIAPYKENGKIIGFKVGRISANSKMAQLGLRVGDILIRANNIELTSFNDAIELYKDIDNIDTLALVVLRGNQEKEIIYEIR